MKHTYLLTMFEMALHAVSIPEKRLGSSESSGLSIATSIMKRVKVTPVVSHTSSNTGVLRGAGGAGVAVEYRAGLVSLAEKALWVERGRNKAGLVRGALKSL